MKPDIPLGDEPAFPVSDDGAFDGLTKFELFAALSMAGFASRAGTSHEIDAADAVEAAHALVEALCRWRQ